MDSVEQFGRVMSLVVFGADLKGIDLSQFHVKFSVKRSDTVTPNSADIRVYNVSETTARQIQKEFRQVILQAGYEGNYGVIFQGNIKQVIIGRETGTDTFIDIIAGDGDRAYNFAIVNTSLRAGSTPKDQLQAASKSMAAKGVSQGLTVDLPATSLPRGKVIYSNARDVLNDLSQSHGQSWTMQDEQFSMIPVKSYMPGEIVILTSKTGMIGTPEQTSEGVNVKCLLNPKIKIGSRIRIDNRSIQRLKINLTVPNSPANIPAPLTADGTYYVLVCETEGDNRGIPWYSNLVCLNMDITTNPLNSVQPGYGGEIP